MATIQVIEAVEVALNAAGPNGATVDEIKGSLQGLTAFEISQVGATLEAIAHSQRAREENDRFVGKDYLQKPESHFAVPEGIRHLSVDIPSFSTRVRNCLRRNCVLTFGDLEWLEHDPTVALNYFGDKAQEELLRVMAELEEEVSGAAPTPPAPPTDETADQPPALQEPAVTPAATIARASLEQLLAAAIAKSQIPPPPQPGIALYQEFTTRKKGGQIRIEHGSGSEVSTVMLEGETSYRIIIHLGSD